MGKLLKQAVALTALFILLGFSNGLYAQRVFTGIVKDAANGGTLPGVNVTVKEKVGVGTVTDIDGKFTLKLPEGAKTLVFSFIGYTSQEVAIAGKTTIDVQLQADARKLDEVVVTALGIKKEKKALGYSVASVKADELVKAGAPMNAMSALQGKASGLQLGSTSAGPTGGMVIKVRNSVSLTEESKTRPLFVVDGIPIFDENTGRTENTISGRDRGTGINDINADDIESVEVLKGAKAAVLYGAEGANGVVLITTKKGSKKRGLGVDFSMNYSWDKVAYYPKLQNEYGTGSSIGYSVPDPANISKNGFWLAPNANGEKVESYWLKSSSSFGPRFDGRSIQWWDGVQREYKAYKNNYQDLFQTGHQSSINVALSNAGAQGSYRFSYTNKKFESITLGADQTNHTFAFNGDVKLNDYMTLKVSSNFTYTGDHNAPFRNQAFMTTGIARDMDPDLIKQYYVTSDGYSYFTRKTVSEKVGGVGGSIGVGYFWNQLQNSFDYDRNHFIQSATLDIKLNDIFSITTLAGMDFTTTKEESKVKVLEPLVNNASQGYYGVKDRSISTYYVQSMINAQKTFGKFDISGFFGAVAKKNADDYLNAYVKDEFTKENWFSLNNTKNPNGAKVDRLRGQDRLYSLLGSAQIAYDKAIYLELQARNDWSSILPPKNNSYFYPGASLSWIFSQSLSLPEWLRFGKLRLSWADVGRPGPRYFGNVDYALGSYGGSSYLDAPSFLPPANLKPERKREYEAGLEMNFFQGNRLTFDFSYFNNNTYNQIISLPVPESSGVKFLKVNAGEIHQNGIEATIKAKPIVSKDFNWDISFNIANYGTKINKLTEGVTEQELWGGTGAKIVAREGGKYGVVLVRPYLLDKNGQRVIDKDNGIYKIDPSNWKEVGKVTPDVIGGLNTTFAYKDFDLSLGFDYQFGAVLLSQTNMYLLGTGTGKKSLQYRDEANGGLPYYVKTDGSKALLGSHSANVPADSKYPFILHDGVILNGVYDDGTKNTKLITAQDYYEKLYWQGKQDILEDQVYKSDYISFRRLAFGYNLPSSLAKKMLVQRARISVFANNLMYIYKAIPNVTPESTESTNSYTENSGLPSFRSFGVGLTVNF